MLSRALSIATVTLLIGCLTAGVVWAVENLDAGKSPSQIFSNTCSACHKSPRGLLKNTSTSSLPGFLRQHYTTGTDMASLLSSYLISNGAADPRYQSKDQPKKKDAKQDGRPDQPDRLGRRQPPAAPARDASRPDADGAPPQGEGARPGRDAKRFARPQAAPDAAKPADGQAPVQAATDSKSGVRQKQGRRGKPAAEEPPKTEQAAPGDAAKEEDASRDAAKAETAATDPAKTDAIKTDAIKGEGDKPASEATKPVGETEKPAREGGPETAKVDAPKENVGSEPNPLRSDPVSPVTAAPPASAATAPEPAPDSPAAASPPVTATTPAPPPATPAGPPVPPISR
ncbi:hypothetical protein IVB22_03030 [Bradyrhizobium sp. 190]|uniref:hypothetical protein n=1 Tax=Bradyrhizobium sp. 190 TaxID=2782658 RepID=UPI001FFA8D13|nr:hypothetical protein [Bradyrhizobium sp. 190]MCK1511562.1 hypothetical protein [Bradyrhizobium sp. 190]